MKPASVAAAVFNVDKQKVLLVKRRDVPIWALPGGGIDHGETPEEAVIREVYEETGLDVQIVRLAAIYTPPNFLAKITYLYECSPVEGALTVGDETAELDYFDLSAIPYPFFPVHRDWLDDLKQHQFDSPLKKEISGISAKDLLCTCIKHPYLMFRFILSKLGLPYNSG